MRKRKGNIGNLLATGICVLAMTVVVLQYMNHVGMIYQKWEVVQLAREYILRMETTGYLQPQDQLALTEELQQLGVTAVDLTGSTVNQVGYGSPIVLRIRGYLGGIYELEEKRTSTAKH